MAANLGDFNRLGETGHAPLRQGRLIQKAGYWYYTTREGVDIGPFDSLIEAQEGVSEFVDFIVASEPGLTETLKHYRVA